MQPKKTKKQILNDAFLRMKIIAHRSSNINEKRGLYKIIAKHAGMKSNFFAGNKEFDKKYNDILNYYISRLHRKGNWDIPKPIGGGNSGEFLTKEQVMTGLQNLGIAINQKIQEERNVSSKATESEKQAIAQLQATEYELEEVRREATEKINDILGLKQGEKIEEIFENADKLAEWVNENLKKNIVNTPWKKYDENLPTDKTEIELRNGLFIGKTYDLIQQINNAYKSGIIKFKDYILDFSPQFYQIEINKDGNIISYRKLNYNPTKNASFGKLLGIDGEINVSSVNEWKLKKQDLILFNDGSYNSQKLFEIADEYKKNVKITVFDKEFKFIARDGNSISIL